MGSLIELWYENIIMRNKSIKKWIYISILKLKLLNERKVYDKMLNKIWPIFIIASFIYAVIFGNIDKLNSSIFSSTQETVTLCLTLLGTMSLWSGIMKIAEKTSVITKLTKILNPIIKILFPELKNEKEIRKEIAMNMIANILGLGNAATPLGIKAMKSMQKINLNKETLSNSMVMLIVLNTASIQIIPTTVIAIRASLNSKNPTGIIFPVWIVTICAAVAGVVVTKILILYENKKEHSIFNNKGWCDGDFMQFVNYISSLAVPIIILIIVVYGVVEKIKIFDVFLEGAKDGIEIVMSIFPTLIGLFVAIGALRSSGILDFIISIVSPILNKISFPTEIMPLALIRPISGSSAIAVATDIMKNYGVDSKFGLMAAVIMGSTETTFYTIAVYTASVGIKKTRFVLVASLIADFVGIFVSVLVCNVI